MCAQKTGEYANTFRTAEGQWRDVEETQFTKVARFLGLWSLGLKQAGWNIGKESKNDAQ